MSLAPPAITLPFLADLCCFTSLHPATLAETLSELEGSALMDYSSANPATLELLSTYYTVYLLSLLLDHDLYEARFLLQRIPGYLLSDPQLANAAALLRALYTRTYLSVYSTLSNPTWTPAVVPLRDRLQDDFKNTTFQLLSKAYKSISPKSAAFYLGLDASEEEAIKLLVAQGWGFDAASGLLKPSIKYGNGATRSTLKDDRIGRLTALVMHLTES
ncbi:COP9 signalosome [Sphaerosporella brunnea]|uniref:COP9 signalosome complex subunit 8 n=1 Tax=Sphaerosporella brunnea TaxID=1250544 RepID=A0A5J5EMA9_9PEZI|nr:COP9 signalosome [Sphaerosporella brunnea]